MLIEFDFILVLTAFEQLLSHSRANFSESGNEMEFKN